MMNVCRSVASWNTGIGSRIVRQSATSQSGGDSIFVFQFADQVRISRIDGSGIPIAAGAKAAARRRLSKI
jgi:hypothetical protein